MNVTPSFRCWAIANSRQVDRGGKFGCEEDASKGTRQQTRTPSKKLCGFKQSKPNLGFLHSPFAAGSYSEGALGRGAAAAASVAGHRLGPMTLHAHLHHHTREELQSAIRVIQSLHSLASWPDTSWSFVAPFFGMVLIRCF